MTSSILPLVILGVPLIISLAIFIVPSRLIPRAGYEVAHLLSIVVVLIAALAIASEVLAGDHPSALAGWLYVDPLGAIFVGIIGVIGLMTGLHSFGYIRRDEAIGELTHNGVKLYYGFFSLFIFTMLLAAVSNNIIMMWVAVEATTLGSVFLVGAYGKKTTLEAAWKYVIICTVGVAFGLYGTVLVFSNGNAILADPHQAILWTSLMGSAKSLDPGLMKIAFVFVLVGFGTKAGLFPMHSWLPDAHSEAPSPASALLSGVLLKCALLIIIRYYALTIKAIGPEFPHLLLLILGTLSVIVAAMLFFIQKDLKRKLAYSSVEHIGFMAVALGVGGPLGVAAALLHAMNHSLAKALLFCGSGNVLMKYGTRDLTKIKGMLRVAPASALVLMIGCLALAGFPPFNVFVSEFMIFTAGISAGHVIVMLVCLVFFTVTIAGFVQIISGSILGKNVNEVKKGDVGFITVAPLVILAVMVVIMGFAVPGPITRLVAEATSIVLDQDQTVTAANVLKFDGIHALFADSSDVLTTPADASETAGHPETK